MPNNSPKRKPDAILIDDDSIVHLSWQLVAEQNSKKLESFSQPGAFLSRLTEYDAETPIFVDSNLGNGVRGEDIAAQIHDAGFKNVYLATGNHPSCCASLSGIKAVVGKEPPWL